MTLDELITNLNACPDQDALIRFTGVAGGNPGEFHSWRGIYAHLAIDLQPETITVGELLERASAAKGETFQGYKGGDYTMDGDTPVWCSEYGYASHFAIVGINAATDPVSLLTHDIGEYLY